MTTSFSEYGAASPDLLDIDGLCNFNEDRVKAITAKECHAMLDASHSSKVAKIGCSPNPPLRALSTNLSIQVPTLYLGSRSMDVGKFKERKKDSRFKPSLFSSMVPATECVRRPSLLSRHSLPAATHLRTPSPAGPSPQLPPTPLDLGSYSSEKSAIDVWPGLHWHPETYRVAKKAQEGLIAGRQPVLAEGCLSGSYMMRAPSRRLCAVFKPTDEEPSGPNNPRKDNLFGELSTPVKGRVAAGGGAVRECIAWLLDKENRAAVPPTSMATALSPFFNGKHPKHGSLQVYMRHECSAEDVGPSLFPLRDVQEIAILDIRLLNQDRHCGNILVSETSNLEECLPSVECRSETSNLEECLPCLKYHSDYSRSTRDGSFLSSTKDGPGDSAVITSNGDEIMDEFESSAASPWSVLSSICPSKSFSSPLPSSTVRSPVRTERCVSGVDDAMHSDAGDGIRLIPIDHGFCLPHPRSMLDTDLAWLQWPQSNIPLDASQCSYVASLDPEQDIKHIQEVLGDLAPPQEYLMSIFIGTTLLQKGVEKGLTLYDIGCLMTRNGDPDKPSKLEWAVEMTAASKKRGENNLSVENCDASYKQALDTAISTIVHEVCVIKGLCK